MEVEQLLIVEIDGKLYYSDIKLKQFRNVDNPHDFMSYDEYDRLCNEGILDPNE